MTVFLYEKNIYYLIHRLLCQFGNFFVSGFLGQMPNDIWSKIYTAWLKKAGAQIDNNSIVHHKVKVWFPQNIKIGKNVKIPASTDMAGMGKITIGDNVLIGANVSFITNHHHLDKSDLSWKQKIVGTQNNINVESFCWIMNDVKIASGTKDITIYKNSWLALGSIVTKNIPAGELWGGCPAKFIRKTIQC